MVRLSKLSWTEEGPLVLEPERGADLDWDSPDEGTGGQTRRRRKRRNPRTSPIDRTPPANTSPDDHERAA